MVRFIETTVLSVGLSGQVRTLRSLPIRVIATGNGRDAIAWLRRYHQVKAMVSRWNLPDMGANELIRRIKTVRPWMPTVVLLDKPGSAVEITARSLGVSAVLPSNVAGPILEQTMAQILGLEAEVALEEQSDSSGEDWNRNCLHNFLLPAGLDGRPVIERSQARRQTNAT